jgi:hypothetical protein
MKYEKRWPKEQREGMLRAQEKWCQKYRNRLNSFCHETAAVISKYAQRQHLATVKYDDSCQTYLPQFPWFQLASLIEQKCTALGIEFVQTNKSKEAVEEITESCE